MTKATIFIALVILLVFCVAPAYAVPALPHAFYGSVTVNGAPASNGIQVSATVDGGSVITNAQNPTTTVGGSYGIDSPYLLVQGDITSGATITFHVTNANGTAIGGTATFEAGGGPTEKNLSVTIAAPPAPGPGPGPGPAPAVTTISLTGLSATVPLQVDDQGIVQATTRLTTADGKLSLDIAQGTQLLDVQGNPLTSLSAAPEPSPPAPPPAGVVVLAYDLGPDGATFSPPITLTIEYDLDALPEGLAEEDLNIAYWDGTEWIFLETTVDTATKTVSCQASHFTIFAVVTPPPAPAAFSISNLSIEPAEVQPGEAVTVTVSVANTGGTESSYTVVLKISGVKEAEESVTVAPGKSQDVSFTVTRDDAGTYSVAVDGLSDSFTVTEEEEFAWWALGLGLGLGALLLISAAYFFWWRRRAAV